MADGEWQTRQDKRQIKVKELEEEADYVHHELMKVWMAGRTDSSLLSHDREVNEQLEDARKDLSFGLRTKPKT